MSEASPVCAGCGAPADWAERAARLRLLRELREGAERAAEQARAKHMLIVCDRTRLEWARARAVAKTYARVCEVMGCEEETAEDASVRKDAPCGGVGAFCGAPRGEVGQEGQEGVGRA
jgi:hypothetical protein